ncbi:uncharacterized protein Ecym_5659 [Eremothecium cymbalariae DBVPG|uniref:Uncharacterized protein n=1 Tax=Eremothecium cymbalariae (strain CBS 270.75 / DBVPG 7215 / KCTC 17166 / NRRL Y-17582) TaxID=931890 RepID=I6NEA0_ERECY|nr:hypothetical protein Ecym_5659 [Eremothecium cymbalariae DBVPG\
MTALDSVWIPSEDKGEQVQVGVYGESVQFTPTRSMAQSTAGKNWFDRVKFKSGDADQEDEEEEEEDEDEEVFSRLNSLSDSEDGIFNLSKVFISPSETQRAMVQQLQQQQLLHRQGLRLQQEQQSYQLLLQKQKQKEQQQQQQQQQQQTVQHLPQEGSGGGFEVDIDPMYALENPGNAMEDQRSLSVDYSLLQSITDNTFTMQDNGSTNPTLPSTSAPVAWNAGIFDVWCNSLYNVVPESFQQVQNLAAPKDQLQQQQQPQQQEQQPQQPKSHSISSASQSLHNGSFRGAGRVYKRSKSVCAGIVSNDCGRIAAPNLAHTLRTSMSSAGRISKHNNNNNNSSSSSSSSSSASISSVSSFGGGTHAPSLRRGSCSAIYDISGVPSGLSQVTGVAGVAAAHGSHHPAVYKYVAQAHLSMQCDTTKIEIENKADWLPISPMTPERSSHIISKLQEKKNVLLDTVYEVFELFPQQHFLPEKLEILALEFEPYFAKMRNAEETSAIISEDSTALNRWMWLNQRRKRCSNQLKQFPRFTVREAVDDDGSPYQIEVRTSSGYNDFTSTSSSTSSLSHLDFLLLRLRHMNLLRESDDRKRKTKYYEFIEGKMKRPLNSFMLYRSSLMKALSILKVVKIVTDLVGVVQKEFQSLDEYTVLKFLSETVKSRRGLAFEQLPHMQRLSEIINEQLYRQNDSRIGNGAHTAPSTIQERVPLDPKFSNHTVLAQVITLMWNSESSRCREEFVKFSKVEKSHHHMVYPKYKYCPVKKLKLEELENNLNITTFTPDLLDGFRNINSGD